jgi:hypothetical protein
MLALYDNKPNALELKRLPQDKLPLAAEREVEILSWSSP